MAAGGMKGGGMGGGMGAGGMIGGYGDGTVIDYVRGSTQGDRRGNLSNAGRRGSINVYGDSGYGEGPDNDYVRGSSQGSHRMKGDDFRLSRSRSSFGNQYDFDEYGQLSTDNFAYRSGSRPPVSGSDTRGRGVVDEGRRNVLKNLSEQVPRYARSSSIGNQFDFRQRRPDRLSRSLGYTEDYDDFYNDFDRSSQGSYSGRPMVDYIERMPDQYSREIGSFSKPKYSPWGPVGESLIDYQYKNTRSPRGSNYDFFDDSRGSRSRRQYDGPYNDARGPRLDERNNPRAPRYNDNFDDRDDGPRGRNNYDSYNDRSGPGPRHNDYSRNNGPGPGPRGNNYDRNDGPGPRGNSMNMNGPGPRENNYNRNDGPGSRGNSMNMNGSGPRGNNFDPYDDQDDYAYSPRNLSPSELKQRRNNLMEYLEDLEDQEYQGRPMTYSGGNRMSNRDLSREKDRVVREFEDMENMYGDEFDSYY
jgi:hypothetical protein